MSLTLPDDITQQLQDLAQRENRDPEELLRALLNRYQRDESESDASALREIRLKAYQVARDYWYKVGQEERRRLSDAELDEQFAFIDADGVPRLKTDPEAHRPPQLGTLRHLGQALLSEDFHSGLSDQAARSRSILDAEFTVELLKRRSPHDADE